MAQQSYRQYGNNNGNAYGATRSYGRSPSSSFSSWNGGGSMGGGRKSNKPGKNEFGISYGQQGSKLSAINWDDIELQPFQKNFYQEAPSVAAVSEEEIQKWRNEHSIQVMGRNIPKPIRTFDEAGFPDYIMKGIRTAGFSAPTAIQAQGWPMAMSGRDVVGVAKTGSGKTLGFLLPSIVHINAQPLLGPQDGPIALCIAPTRELAVQINQETQKFARSSKIRHTCVYGGVKRWKQASELSRGVQIVICTPGRLLDFLESGTTNLFRVTYLVIDEADRLLDMGFKPQLNLLFSQVRPDRQVLMWSATWPKEIHELAANFMNEDTIQVSVGSLEVSANKDVTQVVRIVDNFSKPKLLLELLEEHFTEEKRTKILVFTATKRKCNALSQRLQHEGWPVNAIHGDKPQFQRDAALASFKSGQCPILFATDVASRGIHVDDVGLVINFDFASNLEDYVHRIGRTGRCGKKGLAITFFTNDDAKRARQLIRILQKADQVVPPELVTMSASVSRFAGRGRGRGRFRRRY